jgi:hypothetical protein
MVGGETSGDGVGTILIVTEGALQEKDIHSSFSLCSSGPFIFEITFSSLKTDIRNLCSSSGRRT